MPGSLVIPTAFAGLSGAVAVSLLDNDFVAVRDYINNIVTYALDKDTATVTVQNTAVETTIYTKLIPANALGAAGQIDLTIPGTIKANTTAAPDTLTIRVKLGGVTICSGGANFNYPAGGEEYQISVNINGKGATNAAQVLVFGNAVQGGVPFDLQPTTVDWTTNQNLTVTAQWGNASPNNVYVKSAAMMRVS